MQDFISGPDLKWVFDLDAENFLRVFDVLLDLSKELNISVQPEKDGKRFIQIPLLPNQIKFRQLFPADSVGMRATYTQGRLKALAYLQDKKIISYFADNRTKNSWMNDWMDTISVWVYQPAVKLAVGAMQIESNQRFADKQNPQPSENAIQLKSTSKFVFIGHGQSLQWMQLKTFLTERLNLLVDEFNRQSAAGLSTKERLQAMLASAGFAFLVMTAEDEDSSGQFHARENVIHEAGLFQAKLGFERAIILHEQGCKEFSNIHGLNTIRFPRGDISAKFEEVRLVLEREGLVSA